MKRNIYLIGSLRNPQVPIIANQLREDGHDVFDDWYAAGPDADDKWRDYERGRGHSYIQALGGFAARHVYAFDKEHLERADTVVLVLPAGKSGHLELGVSIGQGKDAYILVDDPERWDVMYQFATGVMDTLEALRERLMMQTVHYIPYKGDFVTIVRDNNQQYVGTLRPDGRVYNER